MSFMVDVALKGTAVLGVAWLVAFCMRGRSAAARHMVWTAAFAALLALPFLSVSLPAVSVPVKSGLAPDILIRTSATPSAAESVAGRSAGVVPKSGPGRRQPDWGGILLLLWAVGAAAGSAQILAGWIAMARVRRRARHLGKDGAVPILEAPAGSMPATFGLLHPAVFLPADAAGWSAERRRVVLLHELAHVRRGDAATHLLARLALSLFWWNPLAWTAWREFLKERERAADDLVLSAGARASEYAGHLLEIARTLQSRPAMGWAAVAMARRSQLEGRLLAILDSNTKRTVSGRATLLLAVLGAVVVVAPIAAVRAQEKPRADVYFRANGSAPRAQENPDAVPANLDAILRSTDYKVLDTAAKSAGSERQDDAARKLLDASLALRAKASGPRSAAYGEGLLNLGDLESRRGKAAEAEAFYTQAAAVLGSGPEAAQAYIHLGVLALKKAPEQAQGYFDRAQTAGAADLGLLKMWMAVVRQRQSDFQEADYLYQQAIAMEEPNSASAATILEVYSQLLDRQNRAAESATNVQRARDIRKALGSPVPSKPGPGVFRMGSGITAPQLVTKMEPEYTEDARAAQLQGTVLLYVEIPPAGIPQNLVVTRGLGLGLDEKALEAIRQWKFKPGMKDGQAVTVAAQIEVNFRLL